MKVFEFYPKMWMITKEVAAAAMTVVETEAARAFDQAARRMRGDEAHGGGYNGCWRLNFPTQAEVAAASAKEEPAEEAAVAAEERRWRQSTMLRLEEEEMACQARAEAAMTEAMLLEQDAAASALTHIRGLDEGALDEELRNLSFISAIRARLYDEAVLVHDGVDMWVTAYEDTVASRPDSTIDLRNEIVRRFGTSLTPALRARMGLAEDPLMKADEDEEDTSGDQVDDASRSDATP